MSRYGGAWGLWIGVGMLVGCGSADRGSWDGGSSLADGAMTDAADGCSTDASCDASVEPRPSTPCEAAAMRQSYLGCEYWPVDLDNAVDIRGDATFGCEDTETETSLMLCVAGPFSTILGPCGPGNSCPYPIAGTCRERRVCVLDAQHSPFAVVVSNPEGSDPAEVSLIGVTGQTHTVTVEPGGVEAIYPQRVGFEDQSVDGSSLALRAYRLVSDRPIVAYQFNPLDNVGVFSNDGSLLLPEHTFDTEYYVLTYPSEPFNSYFSVVAGEPDTSVTITPTADTLEGERVPAIRAGESVTLSVRPFEVLNLEAVAGDLSGTRVEANKPIGVFVGHEATMIGRDPVACYADHLEDQILPAVTWGKEYAFARSERRRSEPDLLRVMAQRPGTTVAFTPTVRGCDGTLGPGQFCDVYVDGDVHIEANEPIVVGHFLLSVGNVAEEDGETFCDGDMDAQPPGDPALSFVPPVEQFRESYAFLTPMFYDDNYVSIAAPVGANVSLDGNDVTGSLVPMDDGRFKAARIRLQEGAHTLECSEPCGIELYGYAGAVSYLFPGGLDLKPISIF